MVSDRWGKQGEVVVEGHVGKRGATRTPPAFQIHNIRIQSTPSGKTRCALATKRNPGRPSLVGTTMAAVVGAGTGRPVLLHMVTTILVRLSRGGSR